MKSSILFSIAVLAMLTCVSGCESDVADRHASNRALRGEIANSSEENESLAETTVTPLIEVDMPNGPKGQPTVITAADTILGRQPPTPTELHPTTPITPVGVTIQLQPATSPATAPSTAPASAPVPSRGAADSTTEP